MKRYQSFESLKPPRVGITNITVVNLFPEDNEHNPHPELVEGGLVHRMTEINHTFRDVTLACEDRKTISWGWIQESEEPVNCLGCIAEAS